MKNLYIFLFVLFLLNNANAQWTAQNSGTTNTLSSIYFTDVNTGYVVDYIGNILKTSDAGITWTTLSSGTSNYLSSIYFPDIKIGYAVGENGTILKTIDAGKNWTTLTSETNIWLVSVYFIDNNIGFAVGNTGTILKTINGGTTWTILSSGTTNDLYSIFFTDANIGYTVGGSGIILKTTNGGTNWTTLSSGTTNDLYSICFTDATTGFTIGGSGIILKTTNGGTSWTKLSSGTTNELYSVYFPNSNSGYAVGYGGTIIKTTNGGVTWNNLSSGTNNSLNSVYFFNAIVGYAVGTNGTILKTTTAGEKIKLDSGLVAYYPFNGNANDESGNGNNGTVIGATLTTDRFGNANSAYSLNGINNYISLDSSIRGIYQSSQFTIAGWFKPSNIYGGHIFSVNREPSIGAGQNTLLLQWSTTGFIALWCDSVAYVDYNSITRDTNSWHFFVLSVDNTKLSHLYFDGMFLAQSFTNNKIITSTSRMSLGQEWDGYNPSDFFKGYVDDISIYNRALTTKEIDSLFLKGGWSLNSTCSASYKSSIDTLTGTAMFTNTTTGSNKYYWIFDDGDFSNTVSPTHKYSKDGIYRVSLTANDTVTGCQAKTSQEIKIKTTVVEPCRADFTYSVDSITKTLSISNFSSKGITLNYWEFGDGALSNSTSPIHKYAKEGYYIVRLTVIDTISNCVDNKNVVVKILGNQKPCKANYTYSVDLSSQKIFFVDQSDVSANAKYFWDFNDGDSSIVENPNHTYALGGYFDVCLTIKDSAIKCLNTTCQTLKASDSSLFCQAQFTYSVDTITGVVYFYDNSKGKHNKWEWTYGDGSSDNIQNGKHKYIPGYYTVILNISDSLTGSKSYFVDVINIKQTQKLKAGFGFINEKGNSKGIFPVDFKGATCGDATEYEWDFGDSTSNNTSISPKHDYSKEGKYEVCFKVNNSYTGKSDSTCQEITIVNTGINNLGLNNSINIYPNPTNNKLTIEIEIQNETYNLEIVNLTGQIILTKKLINRTEQVDLSGHPAGVYFIKILSAHNSFVSKIIKQN